MTAAPLHTPGLQPLDPDPRLATLLHPPQLFRAAEILVKPSPVPPAPGVYAWYFDAPLPGVPTTGCHTAAGATLLYVGISPKAPAQKGGPASRQHLRQRITYHFRGNAEGSTLRLTLGCLLAGPLALTLRRVGSGTTRTFTNPGEQRLDAWLAQHARVAWAVTPEPWQLESHLIRSLSLPLNLAGNAHHPFRAALPAIRKQAVLQALSLPVTERGGPRYRMPDPGPT